MFTKGEDLKLRLRNFSYVQTNFVIFFLLQILGPIIRLSLVTWNPLEENGVELEKMEWYNTCMRYSFNEDDTEDQLINDPDVRLIPTLIEKIILPKITGELESLIKFT